MYIQLKGLVDVEAEITKLEKALATVNIGIESTKKKMDMPDYENKVPEKVRQQNQERLEKYETEKTNINKGIENFRSLA